MFNEIKESMMEELEMNGLGQMHYFLSLEIVQSDDGIFLLPKQVWTRKY